MYTTLISADQLAALTVQQSDLPKIVLLDCRHDLADSQAGQKAYDLGHIPGARFIHLDHDLSGDQLSENGTFLGRHPLPDKEQFLRHVRLWGIDNDTQVVAYDAHGGMFAARLWWLLRWAGHSAVAVLDGGLPAWTALSLPLDDVVPAMRPGNFTAKPGLTPYVELKEVERNLISATHTLVDARAPDRFRGENETIDPVGGHIPGAINRFFKDNLLSDGRFKPADILRAEWSAVLPDASKSIMQCGSGVTACHNLLALEIAGLSGAALYPGSWSEWCASPARPVITGDSV